MKTRAPRIASTNILLGISVILVSSCTQYYFQHPQPVDRKNIYHFPKTFRGTWEGKEDSTTINFSSEIPLDSAASTMPSAPYTQMTEADTSEHNDNHFRWFFTINTEDDSTVFKTIDSATYAEEMRKDSIRSHDIDSLSITIKRKFVRIINIHDERVDKESVLIAGSKEDQDLKIYNEKYHRKSDPLPAPTGKKPTHYLKGNVIYKIEKGRVEAGHTYDSSGKEFIIHQIDTTVIELGHYAFLRKLNNRFWVFNACSNEDKDAGWWVFWILEKTKHGTMLVWDSGSKMQTHSSMFYSSGCYYFDYTYYYLNCQWSAAEMLQLMQEGYFDSYGLWYRRR